MSTGQNNKMLWLIEFDVIQGFCGGVFCVIVPLYVSEIADDAIRGRLALLSNTMLSLGIVYS